LLTNLLLEDLNTTATKRCVQCSLSLSLHVGCTTLSLITLCVCDHSGEKTRIINVASRSHTDARDVIMSDSYMFTPTTKITLYRT
jgi:hypothetical protein